LKDGDQDEHEGMIAIDFIFFPSSQCSCALGHCDSRHL